ncbi:MAG: hypothetical protein LC624_10620, partial [Halobacteriales archaeon]|nr:hypothetical protein [Halobacteriales archaeon]
GEEKTQGSFNERSAAEQGGPRYGIYIPGDQPQVMIFMIHNKVEKVQSLYITLSVRFVSGTAADIAAATDCGPLPLLGGESCSAGATFHEVKGKLWGSTFDVPRQASGNDNYVYPPGNPMGTFYEASASGTAIATAGHLHPNGKAVLIANLGPAGSGCEADLDGDGYAGTTLFDSAKLEHVSAAFPHSEDYQMAATQFGWRAPVHAGDRIAQFGLYANKDFASYQAMSYAGFYVDRAAPPPARQEGCVLSDFASYVVGGSPMPATEGILNHAWAHDMPLCGLPGYAACEVPIIPRTAGLSTPVVAISAFVYVPGDQNGVGNLGDPPQVHAGDSLTFVNTDVGLGAVRHTVTSCAAPCNGPYVANYPQPDGVFDSGKLGNLDYIDGGITGDDTVPVWHSPTDLAPGLYTYYCRIHPRMRGAFEVVA